MPTSPITAFAEKVLDKFSNEITDQVFLMIENNKELLQNYLEIVSNEGLDNVNQTLGKKVKEYFKLENLEENQNPKSKLIKSYTVHKGPSK
ncbi:MAG: hypothetical protein KJ571_06930 [Bacteroidetes bacterium]|nr:hypothetical protein [Bacteroidota bacterium]